MNSLEFCCPCCRCEEKRQCRRWRNIHLWTNHSKKQPLHPATFCKFLSETNLTKQNKEAVFCLQLLSVSPRLSVVLKGMMGTRPSSEESHRNEKRREWCWLASSCCTSHYWEQPADSRTIIHLHWVTGLTGPPGWATGPDRRVKGRWVKLRKQPSQCSLAVDSRKEAKSRKWRLAWFECKITLQPHRSAWYPAIHSALGCHGNPLDLNTKLFILASVPQDSGICLHPDSSQRAINPPKSIGSPFQLITLLRCKTARRKTISFSSSGGSVHVMV